MADPNFSNISAYVNSFNIEIVHLPSNQGVKFAAFLNSFNDSFKTNFKSQAVYGRMDPIVNYQNTTRTLSIGFTVPASSQEDAINNLDKMSSLIKFQYPEYTNSENVSGISSPPMCKMKFQNLANEYGDFLYGFFAGVDFVPTNESGYFIDDNNNLYPKEFKVSLAFTVLHTKAPGWSSNKWKSGNFPYKNSTTSAISDGNQSPQDSSRSPDPNDPFSRIAGDKLGAK
jgi:hypothetical protein